MEDQDIIIDERIMTNYDNDETVPSKTIDFTAFLIADGSSNPSVCAVSLGSEVLILQDFRLFAGLN